MTSTTRLVSTADPVGPAVVREQSARTHASPPRVRPVETRFPVAGQLLRQRSGPTDDHPGPDARRAKLIEANLPLARHLARRYAGRGEPLDDLIQVAAVALIKAVDRYDPDRQVPFASYAVPSILGALKRHFRDAGWGMRVGRRTQELTLEIATVTAELSQRLGRSPTTDDLAEALHLPTDVIVIALGAARSYRTSSLNTSHSGADDTELSETIGQNDPGYALVEDNVLLQPLFAGLPPRERRILTMRFFGDMTQAQIAEHTGISQMQVSRLLKRSLSRLRIETQDLSLSV